MLTNSQGFKRFSWALFRTRIPFCPEIYGRRCYCPGHYTGYIYPALWAQKGFRRAWKAKSFIYITARNLCLDHLKHQKIKQQYQQTQSVSKAEDPDFLHEITYQETLRILHQAIDTLPPQTRKIILLGLNGKNNNEIARNTEHFGQHGKIPEKKCLHSLREQLKDPMLFLLFLLIGWIIKGVYMHLYSQ